MNGRNAGSAWVPWACVPLLLLLNFQYYPFEFLYIDLTVLQIPVALALTYRYGRHGYVAALIGAVPLLVSVQADVFVIGDRLSYYVILAHGGWLTLTRRWFDPNKSAAPHTASMVLLLAVCGIGVYYNPPIDIDIGINWWGLIVLYYAFFVLGLRAAQIRWWLVAAGFMVLTGVVLSLTQAVFDYGLPSYVYLTDSLRLRWELDRPGDFLTLVVFWCTGKWIRAIATATEPSADTLSYGVKLALGASILFLARPMWQGLMAAVESLAFPNAALFTISPAGSYYLLPLLALFLAITRRNGMLIATMLVTIYHALYGIAALSTAESFSIDPGDLAVVIAYAMLGKCIARHFPAAGATRAVSWLPGPSADRPAVVALDEWKREHDEISNTVRRVMLSLLAYALFCGLTLASSNDASLYGVGSEIKLPIAGTLIDYSTFLTVGPLILLGLIVYLHLFLQSAIDLGRPPGARPLPYLFNMSNPLAVLLSGLLHYWLPVILLFLFAWKATPQPVAGFWLGLASTAMGVVMVYLYVNRMPSIKAGISSTLGNLMLFTFSLLFAIQMASGGVFLRRPLLLDDAPFAGRDLSGFDFREASLQGASLKKTKLIRANLQQAKLIGADFDGANLAAARLVQANLTDATFVAANLAAADLRSVTGFDCDHLKLAEEWQQSYRDESLACGASIPEPPQEEKERRNSR